MFPLDVAQTRIDFLAADGHKWMLGSGRGRACSTCVRSIWPACDRWVWVGTVWSMRTTSSRIALDLRPAAVRYEGGSQNMVGVLALGASLNSWQQSGLLELRVGDCDRVLEITDHALPRLAEAVRMWSKSSARRRAIGHRNVCRSRSGSAAVAARMPGRTMSYSSCRAGRLRISPHAYTNAEDIERLIAP